MASFKDNEDRAWELSLTVGVEKRIKKRAGVHLSDIGEDPALERIANDPTLLADVLWAIVEPQAKSLGVDEETFCDAIGGDSLEDAYDAVVEATLDFLGRRGASMKKAREERLRIERELEEGNLLGMQEMTGEKLYQMMTQIPTEAIQEALRRVNSTPPPGDSPESAASTPETSLSAS